MSLLRGILTMLLSDALRFIGIPMCYAGAWLLNTSKRLAQSVIDEFPP